MWLDCLHVKLDNKGTLAALSKSPKGCLLNRFWMEDNESKIMVILPIIWTTMWTICPVSKKIYFGFSLLALSVATSSWPPDVYHTATALPSMRFNCVELCECRLHWIQQRRFEWSNARGVIDAPIRTNYNVALHFIT